MKKKTSSSKKKLGMAVNEFNIRDRYSACF